MKYKMLHECYNGTFSWITLKKKSWNVFFKQKFMGTSLNGKIQCVIKKYENNIYKRNTEVFLQTFYSVYRKINTKNNKCILM